MKPPTLMFARPWCKLLEVLQESDVLSRLHMMCGKNSHVILLEGAAGSRAPPPHCSLVGSCTHVFGSIMHGIAGNFTK